MLDNLKFNLLIILFLIFLILGIWVFNQKKNFNPVFSFKNNLSFQSSYNDSYEDISSIFYVISILNEINPRYNLDSKIVDLLPSSPDSPEFKVIGRSIRNNSSVFNIYEYKDSKSALRDFNQVNLTKSENIFKYKNLIIESKTDLPILVRLKERLNE